MDQYLQSLYYNPDHAGSFGGVDAVFREVKQEGKFNISKKKIRDWLSTQDTYTLHKPTRKNIQRNCVLVDGIDHEWQADLVDMSSLNKENDSVNYLLTCIDVFSRHAWVLPLRNKNASALVEAFKKIFKDGRYPKILYTDKGTEFSNRSLKKLLKENDVQFVTSQNETKASVIERFNRTLKARMYKYFTWKHKLRYIDALQQFVRSYNNSYHRSIKMKPNQVNERNEKAVWKTLYQEKKGNKRVTQKPIKFRYNVGDRVRISKTRMTFEKSYFPGWSEEIFQIDSRQASRPPTYRIKDLNRKEIHAGSMRQNYRK